MQFPGKIDNQCAASQPIPDRPSRSVPNGQPSRPASFEDRHF
jgi:hypothetical protein